MGRNKRATAANDKKENEFKVCQNSWNLPVKIWLPLTCLILAQYINLYYRPYTCNRPHTNSVGKSNLSKSSSHLLNLSFFDWTPSTPAKIDDPVDLTGFTENILKRLIPKEVRLEDRDIAPLELKHKDGVKSSVRAFVVDDLLSAEECDGLRAIHDNHIEAMSEVDPIICFDDVPTLKFHLKALGRDTRIYPDTFISGTSCVNKTFSSQLKRWGMKWSYGTGFYPGESQFSLELGRRFHSVLGLNQENGGAFRVVSYLPNVGYKQHTDCTLGGERGIEDRYATVLVYLDDVSIGGQTYFPVLGMSVKPKKGRALVFTSLTPDGACDPTSRHAAQPVVRGHKYILQRWYYYQNFPGLDKRPPVPPIPKRRPTQANVICNEYLNGSCRWYDVWTYDVLRHR